MATTNLSRDNVLAVMSHKFIDKILVEITYLAMLTWFKQICTNLISVETPQDWGRGKGHLGMLQAPAVSHTCNGDLYKPPPLLYPQRILTYFLVQILPSAKASVQNTRYYTSTGSSMSTPAASPSTSVPPRLNNGCSPHSRTPTRASTGSSSATSATTPWKNMRRYRRPRSMPTLKPSTIRSRLLHP